MQSFAQDPSGMGYEDSKRWLEKKEKLKKMQETLKSGG
jgi:hypothetical protein